MQNAGVQVVRVDIGHEYATTGGGLLLMDEHGCRVLLPASNSSGVLEVRFVACTQSVFGYPNDEAQPGHPCAQGRAHGIYEVLGSDWAERLERQNRVRFPDVRWAPKRHFLILMAESMGEFLADDVRAEFHPGGLDAGVFDRIAHQALQQALESETPTLLPHPREDDGTSATLA